jgi:hypothetical protein
MKKTDQERWDLYKQTHQRPCIYKMIPRQGSTPFDHRLFGLRSLNPRQKYVYGFLKSIDHSRFTATLEVLSEQCGVPQSTLNEDIKILVKHGAVEKISCKKTKDAPNNGKEKNEEYVKPDTRNRYVVHPEDQWITDLWIDEVETYISNTEQSEEVESLITASPSLASSTDTPNEPIPHRSERQLEWLNKLVNFNTTNEMLDFIAYMRSEQDQLSPSEANAFTDACKEFGIDSSRQSAVEDFDYDDL